MSAFQTLRAQLNARICAAVDELLGLLEEEFSRSEQENARLRKLLCEASNPELQTHTADVQQPDQKEPEPPHVKEEEDECWISQEEEQTKFTVTLVSVKSEDEEQSQTDADGEEDCGGPGPARNLDPSFLRDIQREWSPCLDQEEPEHPHMEEELSTSEEREQLYGLEEAELTKICDRQTAAEGDEEDSDGPESGANVDQDVQQLDQEEPKPPRVKEEQDKCWISQEEEQLHGEEADDQTKVIFTLVSVKSEDHDVEDQPSKLRQSKPEDNTEAELHASSSSEHSKTGADGEEDCGGPGPARNLDPGSLIQPLSEDEASDSTEPETKYCRTLNRHMRIHSGTKQFNCPVCGKKCIHSGHLKVHMRTHTGEKPFSCSVCGNKFNQAANLKVHMRIHTGEKPFSCSVCGNNFVTNGQLNRHMRTHTGEKPFTCSVCDHKSLYKENLKKHMRIHTGEKPFSCSVCGHKSLYKEHLNRHMRSHTGEASYQRASTHRQLFADASSPGLSVWTQRLQSDGSLARRREGNIQSTTESRELKLVEAESFHVVALMHRLAGLPSGIKPRRRASTLSLPCTGRSFRSAACGSICLSAARFHSAHHRPVDTGAKTLRRTETQRRVRVKMLKFEMLRAQIHERLSAAVDEILGLCERAMEEECSRSQRERSEAPHTADIQQLLVQQEWSPSLDQEEPESPHIKEEQKELWSCAELHGVEEAEIIKVPVKSEEDGREVQSTQLHPNQTGDNTEAELLPSSSVLQMKTETEGEDCGGADTTRNFDPGSHLQPADHDEASDSSETDDWKKSRPPQPGFDHQTKNTFHINNRRRNSGKKSLCCSECGVTFKYKENLQKHLRTHTGLLSNSICKTSTQSAHLKDHFKIRGKPFSCSVCSKHFTQNIGLKRHMRIHTGEKPFICSVCGKNFTISGNLKLHMRIHTGEKPHSCSVCGKSFIDNGNLKRHMQIHTGEKPHHCSVCGKDFTQAGQLKNHMQIHTGEKPHHCFVCGKDFTQAGQLKNHMLVHTGEKPHSCSVCGRKFTINGNLKTHMKIHTATRVQKLWPCKASSSPSVLLSQPGHLTLARKNTTTMTERFRRVEPSKVQMLRVQVTERLSAAVEEILDLFESAMLEYEEEFCRPEKENRPRRAGLTADPPQLLVQGLWSPGLDQEEPEFPHIKEEQEELWSGGQDTEQLHEITTFPSVPLKSEHAHVQPPQHHLSHTEGRQEGPPSGSSTEPSPSEAYGDDDCGGAEPAGRFGPGSPSVPASEGSSEREAEDSEEEGKETREPQAGLNRTHDVSISEMGYNTGKNSFRCSVCGVTIKHKGNLRRHFRIHTGERPFSCSVCGKNFTQRTYLKEHVRIHTGEKPFSCSFCSKTFKQSAQLRLHTRTHTGEKPFNCSVCGKSFIQGPHLKSHMRIHTKKELFSL
ncbi:uncharacterized protein LOC142987970 [Genypterus blacodes]|uniref:uncharacterized protein LOC142987970 n=1 Tax=Genypterus blacodes TaxID=154954 RepID=UPI003F76B0EB